MKNLVLQQLKNNITKGKKHLAVLIDPDSISSERELNEICLKSIAANVDFILVGGSLITNGFFDTCVQLIKSTCQIPVILFPGNNTQISQHADAILFLSLISGRNPELLIGKHVLAAPLLKKN